MRRQSLLILSIFCFSLCLWSSEKGMTAFNISGMADSIVVAGRINNLKEEMPRTVVLIECDPSDKSVRKVCDLDRNRSFCQKIPFSYPHTFTVNYNRSNFINVFAAPGDSIYLDIDASTSPLSVTFTGDHAEINGQYDRAFQYMRPFFYSVKLPADTVPLEEYLTVFMRYVREGRDSVDSYARKHDLSEEVVSMLYADNIYGLANQALSYRGRNVDEEKAFFLNPVFDIFNEDNTKVMIFPYHVKAVMSIFPEVKNSAPKGTVRDIMYACDKHAPVPDRTTFCNEKYYDRLYTRDVPVKEISINEVKTGNISVYIDGEIREIQNENPVQWLLNEYKGHPIYLDISATWCGPCRVGLREGKYLREYLKDSDIRFAIIWLRSSQEEWIRVAPTISNAIQIFIGDAEVDDRLSGCFGVKGFPTYLMIDKKGNITKDGVPPYQSPKLGDFLNSYK